MDFDPFNCEEMKKIRSDFICIGECMAKKQKHLKENGEIDRDAIVADLKKHVAGTEWKLAAAEGIVDKCLAEAKAAEKTDDKCSTVPLKVSHCIWGQFIQSCPAEKQHDSKRCQKIRSKLAKGDNKKAFLHQAFFRQFHHLKSSDDEERIH